MKRYKAFYGHTSGWHFSGPNEPDVQAEANDVGVDIVFASDVAELERRYREAVELLRATWIVLDERTKTDIPSGVYLHLRQFLAGEKEA
jgi:hypothetical protein